MKYISESISPGLEGTAYYLSCNSSLQILFSVGHSFCPEVKITSSEGSEEANSLVEEFLKNNVHVRASARAKSWCS